MKQVKWEIELNVPKGKIKTFVYSEDGTNIIDRFKPEYECKVLGIMKENDEKEKKQIRKKVGRIQSHNGVDKNYSASCDNSFTDNNFGENNMIEDTRSIIYKLNKFYSLSKQELSELQADMKRMIEIAEKHKNLIGVERKNLDDVE